MKKRSMLITTFIALAALTIVPFVYAAPGNRAHGRGFGGPGGPGGLGIIGHVARLQEELGLSDQQVDQIKTIFKDLHEQNAQYREQLHGGMKGVAETLLQDPNNVAAAQAQLDQQSAAENAMKANVLQATSKALNVLNAEQRAKLSTMLAERSQRWERRKR